MKPEMVWVDVETTGLDPDTQCLLEVGIIVTNKWGHTLPEWRKSWVINDEEDRPKIQRFLYEAKSDDFVVKMHQKSGLWADWSLGLGMSMGDTEQAILQWLNSITGGTKYPMCGSSVMFDRLFLRQNMTDLEAAFHYRNIDVSTIREICSLVNRRVVVSEPTPSEAHRPLSDLKDSIALYQHYLDEFFFITSEDAQDA
jgi:oligoribonuclease